MPTEEEEDVVLVVLQFGYREVSSRSQSRLLDLYLFFFFKSADVRAVLMDGWMDEGLWSSWTRFGQNISGETCKDAHTGGFSRH